jgi:hypothetical protein
MYQSFIIPYLYEAQHVFGRHTAYHQEPKTALAASGFVFLCQAHTMPENVHQLHVHQPFTYEKPEADSAVLGSS